MRFYTEEEMLDKHIGKIGSSHRNQFENEINTFLTRRGIKPLIALSDSMASPLDRLFKK